ncbi:uncharacterized protein [Nicotiana sylvestris]|uniref:uncharacterized protein n=1 Tax=Nicotiana sylvestris TaxID=4096 RepID=UPI00388C93B6
MASSSNRAIESVDESRSQYNVIPHLQGGNEEPLPDLNYPRVSENEVGNTEFFRHLAGTMSEPSEMNFEKMRKMGGVEFEGTTDPTVAEQWLECMDRVFEQLECTSVAKFKYVISLLQKDAYDWLSRYAGGIIDGERDKCRRFEEGLNVYIQKSVAILQLEDFSKLISAALTWERINKEEASMRENRFKKGNSDYGGPSKKGKFDYSKTESTHKSSHHKQNKSNFSTASTPSYGQGKTHTPTCAQFGKNHYGACRRAFGACFNCGSMDHKVKDCPNLNPLSYTHIEGSVQKPKNDQDGPNVVAGKFHLFGISVVTLFDPGSSHSYVCSSLAFPDTIKSVRLDFDVLVMSPLGHQAIVNRIYRDCPFMIQNLVFPADLLEMPFQDYDVIVGMDWLHRHHAFVDFRLKQVIFRTPANSNMVVQ